MFSIEMDLRALAKNLFKIIQAANIDGIAIRTHPGPTEYVNPTGVTKVMARLFLTELIIRKTPPP